jgi:hypothetical protein
MDFDDIQVHAYYWTRGDDNTPPMIAQVVSVVRYGRDTYCVDVEYSRARAEDRDEDDDGTKHCPWQGEVTDCGHYFVGEDNTLDIVRRASDEEVAAWFDRPSPKTVMLTTLDDWEQPFTSGD